MPLLPRSPLHHQNTFSTACRPIGHSNTHQVIINSICSSSAHHEKLAETESHTKNKRRLFTANSSMTSSYLNLRSRFTYIRMSKAVQSHLSHCGSKIILQVLELAERAFTSGIRHWKRDVIYVRQVRSNIRHSTFNIRQLPTTACVF